MNLTQEECQTLKDAGFPQGPSSIIASGIEGDIYGGNYIVCREEGECGYAQLRKEEWEQLQLDEIHKTIKVPTLPELLAAITLKSLSVVYAVDEITSTEWTAEPYMQDFSEAWI